MKHFLAILAMTILAAQLWADGDALPPLAYLLLLLHQSFAISWYFSFV
jgi:hypothetical protein